MKTLALLAALVIGSTAEAQCANGVCANVAGRVRVVTSAPITVVQRTVTRVHTRHRIIFRGRRAASCG